MGPAVLLGFDYEGLAADVPPEAEAAALNGGAGVRRVG